MRNTSDLYGPNKICQRTTCTAKGPADHMGGAHLDPRDRERFDGNGTSLRAATYRVRNELYALERVKTDRPELAEVVDVAIHAALKEIQFLGDQNVHIKVDADRQVRKASRSALDCEDHGKRIQALEELLTLADQAEQRAEKSRLALLSGITALDQLVDGADKAAALGKPLPSSQELLGWLREVLKKTHAAHTRSWSTSLSRKD